MGEIKGAMTQVHQWLDQGLSEDQIVLLAPDIEDYWFSLKPHLEREGIAFKKSYSAGLIDFPEVLFWLSRLRLHLGFFTFPDLETVHFYTAPRRGFSDFYSLFSKSAGKRAFKKSFKQKENKKQG